MREGTAALRHKAKKEAIRKENRESMSVLKNIMAGSWTGTKILAHNGTIAILYAAAMFLVFYVDLQAAFYFVATIAGATGSYMMETASDVLTIYTVLGIVCGFCLFFGFKAENLILKAMRRRFWHADRNAEGGIDRGERWHEKHAGEGENK